MADEDVKPRNDPFSPEEAEDPFVPEEEAFQPRADEPLPVDDAAADLAAVTGDDAAASAEAEEPETAEAEEAEGTGDLPEDDGLPLQQVEELTPSAFGPSAGELHALSRVPMEVVVELGRTRMSVEELTGLQAGEVVALDRTAGQSLDIFVNGHPFASGEVVIVDDDQYAIRITEIRTPAAAQAGLL
jgi:flagellar motor switch protein FliN